MIQMNDQRYSLKTFDTLAGLVWQRPDREISPTTVLTAQANRLNPALVQVIADRLVSMGYSGHGDWLSGPCLYPARHRHDDAHPSFGFNVVSGYGNCFRCGSILLKDICTEIGIHPIDYGGLYVNAKSTDRRRRRK